MTIKYRLYDVHGPVQDRSGKGVTHLAIGRDWTTADVLGEVDSDWMCQHHVHRTPNGSYYESQAWRSGSGVDFIRRVDANRVRLLILRSAPVECEADFPELFPEDGEECQCAYCVEGDRSGLDCCMHEKELGR